MSIIKEKSLECISSNKTKSIYKKQKKNELQKFLIITYKMIGVIIIRIQSPTTLYNGQKMENLFVYPMKNTLLKSYHCFLKQGTIYHLYDN